MAKPDQGSTGTTLFKPNLTHTELKFIKSGELKLTEINFTNSAGRFFGCKRDGNIAMAT